MPGQGQTGPAQADGASPSDSAVPAIVCNATGYAVVLAIAAYVLATSQYSPIETATSLAAAVGMELQSADLKWIASLLGATLGAAIGAISGWRGHRGNVALQGEFKSLAAGLGAEYFAGPDDHLAQVLRPFVTGDYSLGVTNVIRIASGSTRIAIAELEYDRLRNRTGNSRSGGNDPVETTRQTVAFLEPDGSTFPEFTLRPGGPLLNMLADVAGLHDIDFPAYPEFSRSYHLSAVHAGNTCRYFGDEMLAALDRRKGLCIQSGPDGIMLYRHNQVIAPGEMKHFASDALAILDLFVKSAQSVAAAAPELIPARMTGLKTPATGLPGSIGRLLHEEHIVRADVEAFLRQPPPRTIPGKFRRQMRDDNTKAAMAVGIMMSGTGGVFIFRGWDAIRRAGLVSEQGLGVAIGAVVACVGTWILFLCIRARIRQVSLLRSGHLSSARIVRIQRDGTSMEDEPKYRMTVAFQVGGRTVEATCKISGEARLRAQSLLRDGRPATILHHPQDTTRILYADALLRISPELEP